MGSVPGYSEYMTDRPKDSGKVMGRPRKELDWDEFDKLCALQCTLAEIANFFKCSEDTVEARVKETFHITFSEYFRLRRGDGFTDLRRRMYLNAQKGNVQMQIFLAKNWLGFSDKTEQNILNTVNIGTPSTGLGADVMKQIFRDPEATKLARELALRLSASKADQALEGPEGEGGTEDGKDQQACGEAGLDKS